MTATNTEFERVLRGQAQVKNIPNSRFEDGEFAFIDYFDIEAFKESYSGSIDDSSQWANWAFEPYEIYLTGVPEIDISREQDDMYLCSVSVDIPDDPERQRLLASLVSDAIKRRRER